MAKIIGSLFPFLATPAVHRLKVRVAPASAFFRPITQDNRTEMCLLHNTIDCSEHLSVDKMAKSELVVVDRSTLITTMGGNRDCHNLQQAMMKDILLDQRGECPERANFLSKRVLAQTGYKVFMYLHGFYMLERASQEILHQSPDFVARRALDKWCQKRGLFFPIDTKKAPGGGCANVEFHKNTFCANNRNQGGERRGQADQEAGGCTKHRWAGLLVGV